METVPTKEMCNTEHARIQSYLMVDFEKKLMEHKNLNHTYFIQTSVPNVCRDLILDKQLVNYLLLGSTPLRPHWGELRDKYDIEPIKYIMRREVVKQGTSLLKDTGFKVYFGDKTGKGDFQMKVDFYPYKKKTVQDDDISSVDSLENDDKKPWVKAVKKFRPKTNPVAPVKSVTRAQAVPAKTTVDEITEMRKQIEQLTKLVSANLASKKEESE